MNARCSTHAVLAALAALTALVVAPASARATPHETTAALRGTAAAGSEHPFALTAAVGGSIQRSALAVSAGARYSVGPRLVVGLDAEWNPWVTVAPAEAVAGVANFYATGSYRIATFGRLGRGTELRTTARLGASVLLFDLVGAPAGSVGPYVSWNLLGVAIPVGGVRVVIEPTTFCLPIPQIHGVPFYYLQYRTMIGVELPI